VEGNAWRPVDAALTLAALTRALGPPREMTEREIVALQPSPHAWSVGAPPSGAGLIDSATLVSGPPIGTGGDPGRGLGALDLLALARARGGTHLLVTDDRFLGAHPDLADHLARRAHIVAAGDPGVTWKLAPPPQPCDPKLFVIGLSKTGTTSVHLALEQLGLRSFHWGGRNAYHAVLQAQRDGDRLAAPLNERYEAFSDIETLSVRFDLLDLQYPGSRFILTVRDVDDWLASWSRHVDRNEQRKRDGAQGLSNIGDDQARRRVQWQRHVDRVQDWFGDRSELLVLDVCGGEGWERLAPFLNVPLPNLPFPQENVGGVRTPSSPWWRRRK
jgi:hypothetical protein